MADLDAELLALAGGDESSADNDSPPPPHINSPSSPSHRRKSPSPSTMGTKGTARAVKKTKTRRVARRHESDDDEGSASSPAASQQSAPMSESDSESGSPAPADDGPIFAYDKYYHSAKDKSEIMAMPEIQREEIIADRAAQVDRHLQDMALRRLLASREREEARAAEKKKRKAGAADLEENQRKSTRQRTTIGGRKAGESSSAIEAYKRQREEKGLRDEQRRRDAAARAKDRADRGSPQHDYSDLDADGESEVEWDDPKSRRRSPTPPKDDPIAELVDIERARVGRDNFAQVCFYPGFEEAMTNCYTRICIGPGPVPNVNAYRLCKIVGFSTGRLYAMTAPNGRLFVTNQYVTAAHGKAQRPWSFLECSNSRFTEDEWRRYRVVLANENNNLPTKPTINKKLIDINKLINHHFTEAEITEKIRRQNHLMDMVNRVPERREIEERRQEARRKGDDEIIQACTDEINALVPVKLAYNTTINQVKQAPVPEGKRSAQDRLGEVNRRNQQINSENIRKAQIAESRVKKTRTVPSATPGTPNNGLLKVPTAAAKALDDDLFGSDRSRAGTPLTGANTPFKSGTPAPGTPNLGPTSEIGNGEKSITASSGVKRKAPFGLIKKKSMDDDIMDLGIEIEI